MNANVLDGRSGNDILLGREGNDTLLGGLGRDLIIGGLGSDAIFGGDGEDLLIGVARLFESGNLQKNARLGEIELRFETTPHNTPHGPEPHQERRTSKAAARNAGVRLVALLRES